MSYVRYQKSLLANGDFEMGGSFESLLGNGTGTTAHESRWREVSIVVGKWRIEMGGSFESFVENGTGTLR